jgi:pimeloyl-ACP methyl ester carboxylesterase
LCRRRKTQDSLFDSTALPRQTLPTAAAHNTVRLNSRLVGSTIDIPTIVVVGKEDRVTPVQLSYEIQNLIRESKLHVIPDCGHLPPIEKPHEVAALLSAFITPEPTVPGRSV